MASRSPRSTFLPCSSDQWQPALSSPRQSSVPLLRPDLLAILWIAFSPERPGSAFLRHRAASAASGALGSPDRLSRPRARIDRLSKQPATRRKRPSHSFNVLANGASFRQTLTLTTLSRLLLAHCCSLFRLVPRPTLDYAAPATTVIVAFVSHRRFSFCSTSCVSRALPSCFVRMGVSVRADRQRSLVVGRHERGEPRGRRHPGGGGGVRLPALRAGCPTASIFARPAMSIGCTLHRRLDDVMTKSSAPVSSSTIATFRRARPPPGCARAPLLYTGPRSSAPRR